jgi:hypothetical protein
VAEKTQYHGSHVGTIRRFGTLRSSPIMSPTDKHSVRCSGHRLNIQAELSLYTEKHDGSPKRSSYQPLSSSHQVERPRHKEYPALASQTFNRIHVGEKAPKKDADGNG